MTTKTTGAEFKRFYNDKEIWPDDTWAEDEVVTVDGSSFKNDDGMFDYDTIPDAAIVTVAEGYVDGPQFDGEGPSFETYFKRWKKKQTTATLIVECPLDKVDAVKAAIKAAGGKVS